jgi:hypothetical protein
MATIEGIAPIIRAALATLEAQFPDHVATFNAEPANLVDLVAPAKYVFGADPVMDAFPIVEVSSLEGTMGPFSVGEAGAGDADSTPQLNVVVWLQGLTGEVPDLYEAGLGYVRCVIEILAELGALGDNAEVSGTQEDAIRWSIDVIPGGPDNPDRELRRWKLPCQIQFRIEAVERWN